MQRLRSVLGIWGLLSFAGAGASGAEPHFLETPALRPGLATSGPEVAPGPEATSSRTGPWVEAASPAELARIARIGRPSAGAPPLASRGGGAAISDLSVAQVSYRGSLMGFNSILVSWTDTVASEDLAIVLVNRATGAEIVNEPIDGRPGSNGLFIHQIAQARYRVEIRPSPAAPPVATVLQDILDQQPFSDVTLLEVGEEPGPGPCRVRASWCHDGVLPDSYRILLDGVVVLELEDAGTAREATVPVSGPGTACALVVGFAAGASLFDPGQLGSEGGFLGAGTQTCAWVRCDGSAACDPVPGPEKCTAGCRAPGGLRLCQIRHGSSNDNEVLATWTNGGIYPDGIRGFVDGVDLGGVLPGTLESASVFGLFTGTRRIGIQGDCGASSSPVRERTIELVPVSPVAPAVVGPIACEWRDGTPPTTTLAWTPSTEGPELIAVWVRRGTSLDLVVTLPGDTSSVRVLSTLATDQILLQFLRTLECDCHGSELVACSPDARNSFIRGVCDGQGGAPTISSPIQALNWLFLGGRAPPCLEACDADASGELNVGDPILVLNYLFLGGPAPTGWSDRDGDGVKDPVCETAGPADCLIASAACP